MSFHDGWSLRRSGKSIEGSDRLLTSEDEARDSTLRAIETDMKDGFVEQH